MDNVAIFLSEVETSDLSAAEQQAISDFKDLVERADCYPAKTESIEMVLKILGNKNNMFTV